jgi:hypothetical protein
LSVSVAAWAFLETGEPTQVLAERSSLPASSRL